jgi:hypothetical protein
MTCARDRAILPPAAIPGEEHMRWFLILPRLGARLYWMAALRHFLNRFCKTMTDLDKVGSRDVLRIDATKGRALNLEIRKDKMAYGQHFRSEGACGNAGQFKPAVFRNPIHWRRRRMRVK